MPVRNRHTTRLQEVNSGGDPWFDRLTMTMIPNAFGITLSVRLSAHAEGLSKGGFPTTTSEMTIYKYLQINENL
jgi:hypothetical protein